MKTGILRFVLLVTSSLVIYMLYQLVTYETPRERSIRYIQDSVLESTGTPMSEEEALTFLVPAPMATPVPAVPTVSLPTPVPAVPTASLPTPTATPVPTPATLSFSSMVAMARPSVVRINTSEGGGSGVIFETDGESAWVLTNAHVVGSDTTVTVTVNDTSPYTGLVRGVDATRDLAVVRICCGSFRALQFGTTELGDEVALMGYPLSQHLLGSATVTKGVVSAFRNEAEGQRHFVQTDAAANPGNSGGPMLNMRGEIVGILTFGYRDAEGVSFAVSPQTAMPAAHTLKTQTPPATPTVVPWGEGKHNLPVVELAAYHPPPMMEFYVEYVNNTTIIADSPTMDIQFFDANKQPLTAVLVRPGGVSGSTRPGERGFAHGQVTNITYKGVKGNLPEKWHSYQVSLRSRSLSEAIHRKQRDLRITNLHVTGGARHIAGTVTNDGLRVTRGGSVFAVVRKSNGALHAVSGEHYLAQAWRGDCGGELAPDESCQFNISLYRELPPGGSYMVRGHSW